MVGDGSKVSAAPPRKINVQKFAESRAPELETLHSIVSNRLNNDFRSKRNKRRRTSAYNNQASKKRCRKRRKLGAVADKGSAASSGKEKALSRHVRRRLELTKNPESGFSTSGDGTKRLRTHVWHAKRFSMTKRWGFHLPLGLQGRGRGSRALLKWYKHGAVVHDASYGSAVQLEGPEDSLLSILRMVLEASPSSQLDEINNAIISGTIYGSAMLHHVGAPISRPIAPVTYMWRPCHLWNGEIDGNIHNSGGCNKPQNSESPSSNRQLWVWVHASAFSEGYDALQFACQKEMNESGILINCFSLEGELAKLEVMGSKAFPVLQKILHPDSCNPTNSRQPKKYAAEKADQESEINNKFSILENEDNICSCAVLTFTVRDPREISEKRITDVLTAACTVENYVSEYEAGKDVAVSEGSVKIEVASASYSELEGDSSFSDKRNLWDASSRVTLPVEENARCLQKHHQRMAFICLDDPKSGMLSSSTEVQGSTSCPIMLLKNSNQTGFMGWSIIMPISWVRVFWIPLISKGVHAIGLREKQWIACDVGLPVFPLDFPDSNSYISFMETARIALDQKAEQLPSAVRPLKVPIPPPWNSVRAAIDKRCIALHMIDCNLFSSSKCGAKGITSLRDDGNSFEGFIARTSSVLTNFLNEINGEKLLLFPHASNDSTRLVKSMKDESKRDYLQNGFTQITCDRKLCFVRVLLHAHKEGIFEEGAVICAPCLGDLSLLTSRSEKNEAGFQIPQSSVRSYFKEQAPGKWELQLPEDLAARESYRWPIGFITAGFIRGSKKPVAVAFCEAVLLARLREKQWNEIPAKRRRKEIYVLVRNLRSSAYRLGLASTVLEQQEDLEFL